MDSTKLLVFFFIGFGFTTCSDTYVREYHYVTQSLNWTEAQKYCRENYTDLATFESAEDLSRLNRPNGDVSYIWIGLTDAPKSWESGDWSDDSNPWRWSATDKPSETGYHNWPPSVDYEQYRYGRCVTLWDGGQWFVYSCSDTYSFICFKESNPPGQRNYTLITNKLTWTEAQTYCRTNHTDLATIENAQENTEVDTLLLTNIGAWIGLYREPWRWSDNSNSSFTNWKSGQPDKIRQNCVAEDSTHAWHDEPCDMKHSFLCYKDLTEKKKTMVRMKIQTFADLSDPATNAQFLQQLSEKFKALNGDVKLRWVTQPTKQVEHDDEDDETCS